MRASTIIIATLAALLAGTNAYWLFTVTRIAENENRLIGNLQGTEKALGTALIAISEAGKPNATKESVVAYFDSVLPEEHVVEDGYVWVGFLGLKFDQQGKLVEAIPRWQHVRGSTPNPPK